MLREVNHNFYIYIKKKQTNFIILIYQKKNYFILIIQIKDISDFKKLDKNLVYEMDKVLTHDIPELLQKVKYNIK